MKTRLSGVNVMIYLTVRHHKPWPEFGLKKENDHRLTVVQEQKLEHLLYREHFWLFILSYMCFFIIYSLADISCISVKNHLLHTVIPAQY